MSANQSTSGTAFWNVADVLVRWLLGTVFIVMGAQKVMHPALFLKLVRQYELFSNPTLLNAIAAGLPWFEVFCGLLLIAGVAVRGTAFLLVLMLVPFTVVVLHRAVGIAGAQGLALCAVKFDCGCGAGEVLICKKVLENCGLIALACGLLWGRGRALCARFSVFG